MQPTTCGRYCGICQQEVFDLTKRSGEELKTLLQEQPGLCGRFTPEQLDPSLIAPIRLSSAKKRMLAASTLLLFFTARPSASAKSKAPVEWVSNSPAANGEKAALVAQTQRSATADKPLPHPHRVITLNKRRIYLSWRFPFIIVRKYYFMGKF